MRQETLAETLRAWAEACKVFEDAATRRRETHDAVPEKYRYADRAEDYLRGYDDAKAEMDPTIEKMERRVEVLEAALDTPKPAAVEGCTVRAVGVVGAVRWGHLRNGQLLARVFDTLRDATLCEAHEVRVVAIVDPARLVPLASAEPAKWTSETGHSVNYKQGHVCNIPLYPGLAQPEQEGDG